MAPFFGFGWGNPYYCPPYAPIYTGGGFNNTIIVNNTDVNVNNRAVVRGGRLAGASVTSVQTDSQNGAQLRTRSQRIVQRGGNAAGSSSLTRIERTSTGRVVAAGRSTNTRTATINRSRADLTVDNIRRVNTDAIRNEGRSIISKK